VYEFARSYCAAAKYSDIVSMLTEKACTSFFDHITKVNCAKVVRGILDLVCTLAPEEFDMQVEVCQNVIQWCRAEKRTFLRQRVEAKLASVMFAQRHYGAAIALIDNLLVELKNNRRQATVGRNALDRVTDPPWITECIQGKGCPNCVSPCRSLHLCSTLPPSQH
jgi:hypothetical protein